MIKRPTPKPAPTPKPVAPKTKNQLQQRLNEIAKSNPRKVNLPQKDILSISPVRSTLAKKIRIKLPSIKRAP